MPRIPKAMKTLIAQVHETREDAEVNLGEPDGFNVYRQVSFDDQTSKWLTPIIDLIAPKDARITNHFTSRGGMLIIDFSTGINADDNSRFLLPEVDKVLNDPGFTLTGTAHGEAPEEKEEPAKKETSKAPAKKAAKKAPAKKTLSPDGNAKDDN